MNDLTLSYNKLIITNTLSLPKSLIKKEKKKGSVNKKCYPIFFYHLKKQLYYLYHTILQFLPHSKTLFLLKYFYLIFLYYFFLSWAFHFPGLSNRFFFFSQAPSTFSTNHKHKHKPSNPRRISLPPSTTSLSLNLSLNRIFFP